MRLHLLAIPLLATGLLLSTQSCSKKSDPDASPANTGTYTRNGVVTPCQVTVRARSGITDNLNADYLDVQLTPTDPQRSGEAVSVYFSKPIDAPTSTYELTIITFSSTAGPYPFAINYSFPDANAMVSQLSSGGYSGTFSATFNRFSNQVITAGAFTNVRP
jgi:hypothetical protein